MSNPYPLISSTPINEQEQLLSDLLTNTLTYGFATTITFDRHSLPTTLHFTINLSLYITFMTHAPTLLDIAYEHSFPTSSLPTILDPSTLSLSSIDYSLNDLIKSTISNLITQYDMLQSITIQRPSHTLI